MEIEGGQAGGGGAGGGGVVQDTKHGSGGESGYGLTTHKERMYLDYPRSIQIPRACGPISTINKEPLASVS